MTKAASSNSLEQVSPESPSCSTSTSSTEVTEVYNSPLGQGGGIYVNDEKLDFDNIRGLAFPSAAVPTIQMTNTDGVNNILNTSVDIKTGGPTTINFVAPAQEPNENGLHKNGQIVHPDASPSEQVPKSFKQFLKKRPVYSWLAGLLLAVMSIAFVVLFFYLYNTSATPVPTPGHDDNLGDDIQIIQREEWLARDPLNTTKILGPLKMVRILHSGGANCIDYQTCANKILGLQGEHVIDLEMPDIAYNFMIGGDGNVYIGRGADVQNDRRHDAIDVAYIGNFLAPYDKVTDKMDKAGKRIIQRLLERGKITEDYVVVAENQTEKVTSPGENVFEKIVLWPHYDNGLYFDN